VLPTLAHWAAGQGWVARAGAVLLAYGCPSDAAPDRVRRDHLAAGLGVGHAQAVATALGLPSRPVGSWQGADLGAALGGPAGRDWVVHGLALGRTTQGDEPS
jgi:nitroreductase